MSGSSRAITAAGLILAGTAHASTVIIDEDFQSTIYSNDTHLLSSNSLFTGWSVTTGTTQRINTALHTNNEMPQGSESPNQGIQFEYKYSESGAGWLSYATGYNWNSTDTYTLSLNATELNWNNGADRSIGFRIREAVSGDILYDTSSAGDLFVAQFDSNHAGTGDDWSAGQLLTWNFSAGDFVGGTEGSAIIFDVQQVSGTRGTYVDNILLVAVPEPSAALLGGLGCLLLLRRRRA